VDPLCNATALPLEGRLQNFSPGSAGAFYWKVTVVTSEAENQYRKLARDFHLMARDLPPGAHRSALLEMAQEWDRLAEQQEPRRRAG
jgi:hypothetical protein